MIPSQRIAALAILALAGLFTAACGGGDDPVALEFDVDIRDQSVQGESRFVAKNGDTVSLHFSVDEPSLVHLHGYDIEKEVLLGAVTTVTLNANMEGSFVITVHSTGPGDEHDEEEEHQDREDTVIGTLYFHPR
jgi:hypothetical protein